MSSVQTAAAVRVLEIQVSAAQLFFVNSGAPDNFVSHMGHEVVLDLTKNLLLSPLHPACAGVRSIVEPVQM